jgi:hypothetical protein
MGILVALLDRLGHYEPASVISAFFVTPVSRATYPEITTAVTHLRDVLGDTAYDALARSGASMTDSAKARYALEQVDLALAELHVDEST